MEPVGKRFNDKFLTQHSRLLPLKLHCRLWVISWQCFVWFVLIYLFLAVLSLLLHAGFSFSCSKQGYFVAVQELFIVVASLVVECRL